MVAPNRNRRNDLLLNQGIKTHCAFNNAQQAHANNLIKGVKPIMTAYILYMIDYTLIAADCCRMQYIGGDALAACQLCIVC